MVRSLACQAVVWWQVGCAVADVTCADVASEEVSLLQGVQKIRMSSLTHEDLAGSDHAAVAHTAHTVQVLASSDPVAVAPDRNCPQGFEAIMDEAACENAAGVLESHPTWSGRRNWRGAQFGCITSNHGQVFWNRANSRPNAYNPGHPRMCYGTTTIAIEPDKPAATDEPQLPPIASNQDAGQGNNVWVHLHNEKRALHGACPIVWNEAVAAGMQEWVDGLTNLEHADSYGLPPPQGPAGENLAFSSGQLTAEQTVNMWYNEVNDCITLPGCEHGRNGAATGHFTSMVWQGVQSIGCAISPNGHFSGCRYRSGDRLSSDTANMAGQYVSNVAPSGSAASGCR